MVSVIGNLLDCAGHAVAVPSPGGIPYVLVIYQNFRAYFDIAEPRGQLSNRGSAQW
jgi:hypothetical protein